MSVANRNYAEELEVFREQLRQMQASGNFEIPPLPAVLLQMQQLVSSGDYGAADLAAIARSDPAVSATVLRYAQRTALSSSAISLEQAIARVGSKEMLRITYAATLGETATGSGVLDYVRQRIWQRAVTSAVLCEQLSSCIVHDAETAFLAGLLHDFGQVVAAAALEKLLEAKEIAPRPATLWLRLVETNHVQIGQSVAERWELPQLLCDVIGHHHQAAIEEPLTALVAQSDRLVAALETSSSVSPNAIANAALGGPAPVAAVQRAVEALPALVAALTARDGKRRGASAVEHETPESDGKPLPSAKAIVKAKGKEQRFDIMHASRDGITLRGKEPLQTNYVVPMTIQLHEDAQSFFWNVVVEKKVRGRHLMELHPFGLQGEARDKWWSLVDAMTQEEQEAEAFSLAAS